MFLGRKSTIILFFLISLFAVVSPIDSPYLSACSVGCGALCSQCTKGICTRCSAGSYSDPAASNVCKQYPCTISGCAACDSTGKCLTCSDAYAFYNTNTNSCEVGCNLANCSKCKAKAYACETCSTGFALYAWDGSCRATPISDCLELHDWRGKEFVCSKCVSGKIPTKDQTECMAGDCRTV